MTVKPALDVRGYRHQDVDYVRQGVAAGWRVVRFLDGRLERMTVTELVYAHDVDPFTNLNPLDYDER